MAVFAICENKKKKNKTDKTHLAVNSGELKVDRFWPVIAKDHYQSIEH